LRASEALYRQLTEDMLDVIWKVDRNLVITYISSADERVRGFNADAVVGHHAFEVFTAQGIATVKALQRRRLSRRSLPARFGFTKFEAQHRCKDGRLIWGEIVSKAEVDEHGTITGYHGSMREITERKLLEQQVRQLAFHDTLTDLPNRRLLLDRLTQAMAVGKRSGATGALMFLDLDNFKLLNDSHGHATGDALLLQIAARLKHCVRESDTVARFGGDEFVVLLVGLDIDRDRATSKALCVAQKILDALSRPYRLTVRRQGSASVEVEHCCSASIGVAVFTGDDAGPADVLQWADSAMYRAKDAGRRAVRLHGANPAP
jgi:diguanylate cyclase (GGDEF)-like protein/PAS domain S-box-containing protein